MVRAKNTYGPTIDRVLSKTEAGPGGCWIWTAGTNGYGYGSLIANGKRESAHRVTYEFFVSEIPDGLVIDHLCRNRACVNPWHLEPVTQRVNVLRGTSPTAINAAKTECPKGHSYAEDNTVIDQGKRKCRTCRNARQRAACAPRKEVA